MCYFCAMDQFPEKLRAMLNRRREEDSLRTLSAPSDLADFSSNDYLGLAQLPPAPEVGASGSAGSRLIRGNHQGYPEAEAVVARFHQAESALVYTSGYDANLGLLSSVALRSDVLFYDALSHASIRDGVRLSQARSFSFEHNNIPALEKRYRQVFRQGRPEGCEVYVVSESVFSMEGDLAPVEALLEFCRSYKCRLILDEAHAVGVLGPGGRGLASNLGTEGELFARVVTFGKALGCHGAAVLGGSSLREYLVNFSRSLIYTTALPPGSLAQIGRAYALLESMEGQKRMEALQANIRTMALGIEAAGLQKRFTGGASAVFGFTVGGNRPTRRLAREMAGRGFDIRPILSPTVPTGRECLRICLHSYNTPAEIQEVLRILETRVNQSANEQ